MASTTDLPRIAEHHSQANSRALCFRNEKFPLETKVHRSQGIQVCLRKWAILRDLESNTNAHGTDTLNTSLYSRPALTTSATSNFNRAV